MFYSMDPKSKDSFDLNYSQTNRAPLPGESSFRQENQLAPRETVKPEQQPGPPVERHEPEAVREQREQMMPGAQPEGFLDETIEGLKRKLRKPKPKKPTQIPQVRDALTQQVESILADGLNDAFK